VRAHESEEACLVFDDTIVEKAYLDENELICWHYDPARQRNVKGINLLTGFYVCSAKEEAEPLSHPGLVHAHPEDSALV
jgi:hypothetical protein